MTSLDLLVIVFMILVGASLLSVGLMFLLKNKKAKKVSFYIVSALAIYMAYAGIRIGIAGQFSINIILGALTILLSIGSIILERVLNKNEKVFLISRITSVSALLLGLLAAFII